MIESKEPHVGTHTERNAFPIRKSIVAGILSLLVIRYVFGVVPLTYPIDKEHVDYYYHGMVARIATPNGYCYTGQSDLIENLFQLSRAIIHYEDPFKFITFRTFRKCEAVYNEETRVYGYHRFLSPRYYWQDKLFDYSPKIIGFTGVGAELIPSSSENVEIWLQSNSLEKTMKGSIWSSKLLPYYPQYDSYDESFGTIVDKTSTLEYGKCNISMGVFLEVDFGIEKEINKCKSEGNGKCKKSIEIVTNKLNEYWHELRNNHKNLDKNGSNVTGLIRLALYVTPYEGRAIYYGFAEEINAPPSDLISEINDWGEQHCNLAEKVSRNLTLKDAERKLFGFSNLGNNESWSSLE